MTADSPEIPSTEKIDTIDDAREAEISFVRDDTHEKLLELQKEVEVS